MNSPSDTTNRTLHYVEVNYFKGKTFTERKLHHYPKEEATRIYQRTINKFTEDITQKVIVCLREENHELIKAFNNF